MPTIPDDSHAVQRAREVLAEIDARADHAESDDISWIMAQRCGRLMAVLENVLDAIGASG